METQKQVKQRNSQDAFMEFFKGLNENYQKYLINEMKKKPPDHQLKSVQADSARLDGGPVSR